VLETMIPSQKPPSEHASKERYWGQFSGLSLLQRMRKLCSQVAGLHHSGHEGDSIDDDFVQAFDSASPPEPSVTSWEAFALLPSQEKLMKCVDVALEQACCLLNFIDRPALLETVRHIYDTDSVEYTLEDRKSLALVFAILALARRFEGEHNENQPDVSKGSVRFATLLLILY